MDTPGNLSQQGLVPIFALSHYIVCPYQFEATSISSTATFIGFIAKLQHMLPIMKSRFIFVVNKWDKRYGRKAELELWDKTEERLRHFGLVAPRIEVKADMQRYNTIELMGPQNDIVSPTFDFMYQQILEPKEQTK